MTHATSAPWQGRRATRPHCYIEGVPTARVARAAAVSIGLAVTVVFPAGPAKWLVFYRSRVGA